MKSAFNIITLLVMLDQSIHFIIKFWICETGIKLTRKYSNKLLTNSVIPKDYDEFQLQIFYLTNSG